MYAETGSVWNQPSLGTRQRLERSNHSFNTPIASAYSMLGTGLPVVGLWQEMHKESVAGSQDK